MSEPKFSAIGTSILSPVDNTARKEVSIPYYDEQIQFTGEQGEPVANMKYSLCLEDGAEISGVTDWSGKTARIMTRAPLAIVEAQLFPVPGNACGCHRMATLDDEEDDGDAPEPEPVPARAAPVVPRTKPVPKKKPPAPKKPAPAIKIPLAAVKTNQIRLGTSVVTVKTPQGKARGLTAGEISMLKIVFKDAINYANVMVCNYEFLPFGWQPDDTAMTPNGHVYYSKVEFKEDFSLPSVGAAELQVFIHEMVHVWQHQLGYPVMLRGMDRITLKYKYQLAPDRTLSDYDMEQQGDLLADYWAFVRGNGKPYKLNAKHHINDFELYKKVLAGFIANPKDRRNLPTWLLWHHDGTSQFKEGRSKA